MTKLAAWFACMTKFDVHRNGQWRLINETTIFRNDLRLCQLDIVFLDLNDRTRSKFRSLNLKYTRFKMLKTLTYVMWCPILTLGNHPCTYNLVQCASIDELDDSLSPTCRHSILNNDVKALTSKGKFSFSCSQACSQRKHLKTAIIAMIYLNT